MKIQPTAPTGTAQAFEVNETFYSTTDARGVITAGNQVFCRISGYSLAEMVGQPHNLIRHPDMPRHVFRLLWEAVRDGKPFMGYVKNQARNGNHYWVFAVVVCLPEGYLSVRIKPTSPLLAQVEALYRTLAAAEAEALAAHGSEGRAADAAGPLLAEAVRGMGFADYTAFSHHALNTEIKCRDAEVAQRGLALFPPRLAIAGTEPADGKEHPLAVLYAQALATYAALEGLFGSLDHFIAACRGIAEHKDAVRNIAEDFRLNALNAHIAAHPLGAEGQTLGTVAQILNGHGHHLSHDVTAMADGIQHTTVAVADVASNISAARIQIEMLLGFVAEIAAEGNSGDDRMALQQRVADLRMALTSTLQHGFAALDTLRRQLTDVLAAKKQLRRDIIFLQVAQISGLTEVSRLRDASGLHATFTGLRSQIDTGKVQLERLDNVVDELRALAAEAPEKVGIIRQCLAALTSDSVAAVRETHWDATAERES